MCSSENNNSVDYCKTKDEPHKMERKKSTPSDAFHLSPSPSHLSPHQLSPCRSYDGSCSDEEIEEIDKLFETRSDTIERWLREKASLEVVSRIHAITETTRLQRSPKRPSVTSDLFQQWLASSPVKVSRIVLPNYILYFVHSRFLLE